MLRSPGRSRTLTGQVGEYLVAAELARRGLIATTFTSNVPYYDIVASDARGRHVSVQVKTSNSDTWQFRVDNFCAITFRGKRQVIGRPVREPVLRLVVVLVQLGERDRFYVCSWKALRKIVIRGHRAWLDKHGGRRPKNPESLHVSVSERSIRRFEGDWARVQSQLR